MRMMSSLKKQMLKKGVPSAALLCAQVDHVDLFANKRAVFTSSQQEQEAGSSSSRRRMWAVENVNP